MILARVERTGCYITDFVEEKPGTEVLATEAQYAIWGPAGSAHLAYIKRVDDPTSSQSDLSKQLHKKSRRAKR